MPRFYEFFAGGGMARLGLGEQWTCLFANDFDESKCESYARNWGDSELLRGDVAELTAADLPDVAELAWASFPCQDLSQAGSGAGLNGERSGTFWPFWHLIEALRDEGRAPRMVVLENVPGALTSHSGRDFAAIGAADGRRRVPLRSARRGRRPFRSPVAAPAVRDRHGPKTTNSRFGQKARPGSALEPEVSGPRHLWTRFGSPVRLGLVAAPGAAPATNRTSEPGGPRSGWRTVAFASRNAAIPRHDDDGEPSQSRRKRSGPGNCRPSVRSTDEPERTTPVWDGSAPKSDSTGSPGASGRVAADRVASSS